MENPMGLMKIATAINEAVEATLYEGNEYTVVVNVNGTAPIGSTALVEAKPLGSDVFEELAEFGTIDLTDPKSVRISYPGGATAELEALRVTPNAAFIADPTSTIDVLVNVVNIGGAV